MTQQTSVDLPGTVGAIAKLARDERRRVETVKVRDREYFVDHQTGAVTEVLPRHEDVAPRTPDVKVRDLQGIVQWARGCAADVPELIGHEVVAGPEVDSDQPMTSGALVPISEAHAEATFTGPPGLVAISATGLTSAVWPRIHAPYQKRSVATMPLFAEYMPKGDFEPYVDFLGWVDKVRPFMDTKLAEVLDTALESVSGVEAQGTTIRQSGAVLTVVSQGEKDAKIANRVPKTFAIRLPYGDPNFQVEVTFTLTMKVDKGQILVRCIAQPEPMTSEWIGRARDYLARELPEGWTIVVGP